MDDKKVAIVTGGSRGIGRAICLELARNGYRVVVNYRSNQSAAEQTLEQIAAEGGEAETAAFDVSDAESTKRALGEVIQRHKRSIEVLVHNAGAHADGLLAMMSETDWRSVMATNLDGFFHVAKPLLMPMIRRRRGSIVAIASVSASLANPGQANYAAAKAGLISASRTLAAEVAKQGIRVNVVSPGAIDTEGLDDAARERAMARIPMARLGLPEEVARVVRWLCSDDASYVTGQVLGVNGGMA